MPPTMRAVGFHQHGGADVLERLEVPIPPPGPTDVLVRVEATALNRLDVFVREGWPGLKLELPHWGGSDVAGTVETVGPDVTTVRPGDPVLVNPVVSCGACAACQRGEESLCDSFHMIGEHVRGGLAEYVRVPAANVVPRPSDVGADVAACVPVTYMTAWRALVTLADVGPDDSVLVPGAGGGLATACIQVARLRGATVYATTSTPEKVKRAEALGCELVVNYRETERWSKPIWEATGKRGVDVVVDSVGGATYLDSLRTTRRGGTVLVPGATTGDAGRAGLHHIFWNQLRVIGTTMGSRSDLAELLEHVWSGELVPVIDATYPLDDGVEALRHLEEGSGFGKVVVQP